MNDEFNRENDDEVVDSIPSDAKPIDDDAEGQGEYINRDTNSGYGGYNHTTKVIIENGPASTMAKAAIVCAVFSVILCFFPSISFVLALLGAGLALINIANKNNGTVISVLAVIISIAGAILAALSSVIIALFQALFGFLF